MPLSRDEILRAVDLPTEAVDVPEWGGTVLVRGLTAKERLDIAREITGPDGKVDHALTLDLQIGLPFKCMVDLDGKRLFDSPDDLRLLKNKSAAALERVFDVAQRLSGMSQAAATSLKKD